MTTHESLGTTVQLPLRAERIGCTCDLDARKASIGSGKQFRATIAAFFCHPERVDIERIRITVEE